MVTFKLLKKTRLVAKNFFQELIDGRWTSAKGFLSCIEKPSIGHWQEGYINALNGMLLALEKGKYDRFVFINQLAGKETDKFARMFSKKSKNKMHSEFDRGFFSAWVDYIRNLNGRL